MSSFGCFVILKLIENHFVSNLQDKSTPWKGKNRISRLKMIIFVYRVSNLKLNCGQTAHRLHICTRKMTNELFGESLFFAVNMMIINHAPYLIGYYVDKRDSTVYLNYTKRDRTYSFALFTCMQKKNKH